MISGRGEDQIRLRDVPQQLLDELIGAVASYQVGLIGVCARNQETSISNVGSAVLVARHGTRYILTAAHVWEQVAHFAEIGLCIEQSVHDTAIRRDDIVAHVAYDRDDVNWGPDIAFLELSERAIDVMGPGKNYVALEASSGRLPSPDATAGVVAVVGAPTAASTIRRQTAALHAGPWVGGIEKYHDQDELDYFDIGVDMVDLPLESLGGISGGPVWQMFLSRAGPDRSLSWKGVPELLGIVLSESEPEGGRRIVRCHGPKTIYVGGPLLVGLGSN